MAIESDYLIEKLKDLEIQAETVTHAPVFTVEEAQRLRGDLPGAHVKNLFLKNKERRYWLVVALEDAKIDLKKLATELGAHKFSFASAEELERFLGILPGAVSPLALINDTDKTVQLVLDDRLTNASHLNFHPLRNDRTTTMSSNGFFRFLEHTGHKPVLVELTDSA